jgi:hypothetical protein
MDEEGVFEGKLCIVITFIFYNQRKCLYVQPYENKQ